MQPAILQEEWVTVVALAGGLVGIKAAITTALGPFYGLTRAER